MGEFLDRLQHAWNVFTNKDPTFRRELGASYASRPDRMRFSRGNEKTLVTAVYNRIAIDASSLKIRHVRLDENDRFIEEIPSDLNECFTTSANIDQSGRAFFQDVIMSMMDEGVVAIVPIDTDVDIINNTFDIYSLRTGSIKEWFPNHVKVRLYNEETGLKEEVIVPKKSIGIVENPLFAVMNEPNSTLQRLIRKLALLDVIDEQSSSGKLDLIIQLPYTIKSDARRQQAEHRRKDIEEQLTGSKYGIAYADSTEKITQLNRSVENQLLAQIEYLTSMLFSQLGLTAEIMNGTADEKTMNNYYSRTIEPILSAITDEMRRKFLTKTARTQKQSICFFQDPFKLVPTTQLADLVDKFTRNEVMTSNEVRQIVGLKPAQDPGADELRNKNISQSVDEEHVNIDGESFGGNPQTASQEEPITDEELDRIIEEA